MIKDKNQGSLQSLNFWKIQLKTDIVSRPTPSMHLQSPVNMKPSTLSSSELPSHFISRVQSHIQQSLPRIPSNFTSTPFHRQPPRSAHFSILIFSLLPHMVAGLLLPGSSEVTVECRMRRCCKTPLPQGLTLTLS